MTDIKRLQEMRRLGVKWPKGRAIPTYPAGMTDEQKRRADQLYERMSNAFIDKHGSRK